MVIKKTYGFRENQRFSGLRKSPQFDFLGFAFSLLARLSDFFSCIDGNRAKIKNKKAQLKIQQMAFMLMAVTLFFVLVGMFVLVVKFSGLKESASLLEEENAMLLVTKLANSPEFSCGGGFGNVKTNCVDADKVMVLKNDIEKYSDFWGNDVNIEIRTVYPAGSNTECNNKNYPNCDIINLHSEKLSAEHSNFITLCRKESFEGEVYNKCELAKLMVEYK